MPRTAPVVDGTPLLKAVSLRYIDTSGDKSSDSYLFAPTVTALQIDAWVDAMGEGTNSNLYEVVVQDIYAANPEVSGGVDDDHNSVYDVVTILYKNPLKQTQSLTLRAPIASMFTETSGGISDEIDTESSALDAAMQSYLVLINVGGGTYDSVSGRFTERKEINQKLNF